ncbi:MAG: tetratricopeptide repeat protein, partial [Pseudomonadales bacterium]|nr:tetratricopeptide repeat protein [Pseudomonadales bacterium]
MILRLLPFGFFILACMSKPMAISLPVVLVLLDLLLLNRIDLSVGARNNEKIIHGLKIVFLEKAHFYLVMLGMVAITLFAQSSEGVELSTQGNKLTVVAGALQHYISSFLYPLNLSPFYPAEIVSASIADYWLLGLALLLAALGLYFSKQQQTILLLIGCYLASVAPVVGIVAIGDHAFADRYSYLPSLGFYIVTAYWVIRGLLRSALKTKVGAVRMGLAVTLLIAALIASTHQYKNIWQNDLTLWQYVYARYPDTSVIVANNLGNAYFNRGDYELAQAHFQSAIETNPARPRAYSNLASTYRTVGNIQASLQTYAAGVSNNPDNIAIKVSAGFAFLNADQDGRAFQYFTQALNQDEEFAPALLGLGSLLFKNGDLNGAISSLQRIPRNSEVDYDARLLLAQATAYSDKSQAREILNQLRNDYPDATSIDSVSEWIDQL